MSITICMEGISRHFGERGALTDVSASASIGKLLLVTGPNGSGKSTLLKIAAGLLRPSSGRIAYSDGKLTGPPALFAGRIGYVSPELALYDELSALENLAFFGSMRGIKDVVPKAETLLNSMGLLERADDALSGFSSGMKQRMKFCFALIADPEVLILDEPTSTLDEQGRQMVYSLIAEARKRITVIIATNEKEEVPLGDELVLLHT